MPATLSPVSDLVDPQSSTPAGPVVAAFDFDGTLTLGDTLMPFLRRLLGWPTLLWLLLACSPWLLGYALRLISNHRAKAALLHACLGRRPVEEVRRCAQAYVHEALPEQWRSWALQRLVEHQRLGHHCVIVSASPSLYMHLVGEALGMNAVLCTEMETLDGRYTGRLATANCYGEEKVRRLQLLLMERFGAETPVELYAYGDTKGDLPLLRQTQNAWYRQRPWPRR